MISLSQQIRRAAHITARFILLPPAVNALMIRSGQFLFFQAATMSAIFMSALARLVTVIGIAAIAVAILIFPLAFAMTGSVMTLGRHKISPDRPASHIIRARN